MKINSDLIIGNTNCTLGGLLDKINEKYVVDYTVETATHSLTFNFPNSKPTDIYEMYLLGTVDTAANQDIHIQFNDVTEGYYSYTMLAYTSSNTDANLTSNNILRAWKDSFYVGSSLSQTVSAMKYEFFMSGGKILCNWDINIHGPGTAIGAVGKNCGWVNNSAQTKINKIKMYPTDSNAKFAVGTRVLIIKK